MELYIGWVIDSKSFGPTKLGDLTTVTTLLRYAIIVHRLPIHCTKHHIVIMNLFCLFVIQVSRREDKCLVLRISFSGKFGPSDREEDYSTANFRGMKRIGCFDEIEYFTAQPVENFTKK